MIHVLGYIGSSINLTAMAMKNVLWLRGLSVIANLIYIAYGYHLDSIPIMINCSIATGLHAYHVFSIKKKR